MKPSEICILVNKKKCFDGVKLSESKQRFCIISLAKSAYITNFGNQRNQQIKLVIC